MIRQLVSEGKADVNEVEAAGNTPLHNAAYEGWAEGVELLLQLGAKVGRASSGTAAGTHLYVMLRIVLYAGPVESLQPVAYLA